MQNGVASGTLNWIPGLYLSVLCFISLYSFHRLLMVWRFYQHKPTMPKPIGFYTSEQLPKITIQLPIFNEMYVVERLLEAVSKLNYPQDKLEIQVLDDSTDETQRICQEKVAVLRNQNFNIHYIYRCKREGFKAGALANGLKSASGELVMIFDADFVPPPATLLKMVNYFSDPHVAMVQARWGHVNRQYSGLTKIQALMLDGHFIVEQIARHRSGCFFNFNGTAGIWRISAIADAGGWRHTTVTEDLDLSYRAQLKGWLFVYLPEVVVPAELPIEMNAFKSHQYRWAKGSSQVAKNLLGTVLNAEIPFHVKLEAVLHLTNNFNYLLLLLLLLLSLPYQIYVNQHRWKWELLIYLPLFLITTFNLLCYYGVSQREQNQIKSPWKFGYQIFLMMSIGIGLAINQSLAVCDGLLNVGADFVRTPKHGVVNRKQSLSGKRYRSGKTWVVCLESLMLAYLAVTLAFAVQHAHYWSIPFLAMFCIGYLYVMGLSLYQNR
jgi:cellulose synthase/poly-beta-1,6-N-acetylglucosamine synthase-like glycosyltransferase